MHFSDSRQLVRATSPYTTFTFTERVLTATSGLYQNYSITSLTERLPSFVNHYVDMASLLQLTGSVFQATAKGSASFDAGRARARPTTAGTGTGWPRFRDVLAEYFKNSDSVNFQGALAYLDWSFVFSESYVTLMHAGYVNFGNSIAYLHWDFEIRTWNFELSVDVTDELVKILRDLQQLRYLFS